MCVNGITSALDARMCCVCAWGACVVCVSAWGAWGACVRVAFVRARGKFEFHMFVFWLRMCCICGVCSGYDFFSLSFSMFTSQCETSCRQHNIFDNIQYCVLSESISPLSGGFVKFETFFCVAQPIDKKVND